MDIAFAFPFEVMMCGIDRRNARAFDGLFCAMQRWTGKATRDHENAGHPLVTTPSEAKGRLADRSITEKARKGLQQIAETKELSSEDRKARIQRIKAFKKRTLRAK